jgi:SAM-dependent methyltransferase
VKRINVFYIFLITVCNQTNGNDMRAQKIQEFLDLKKLGQEQYQDIVINGEMVSAGVRECKSRLDAIVEHVLSNYADNREITVLDIGASQGYFSFEIARLFPRSTCVMIEGNYNPQWRIADQLEDLCHLNDSLDNIVYLKTIISLAELQKLARCEHFDVVLAFNVIHHFGNQWKDVADAIMSLGDNIIIETPPSNDSIAHKGNYVAQIESYIKKQDARLIAETPRHTAHVLAPMYWIEKNKNSISAPCWFQTDRPGHYEIISTYDHKELFNRRLNKTSVWHKGINLTTFCALHGVYPTYQHIASRFSQLVADADGDLTLWNIILSGKDLTLIDQDDVRWKTDDVKALALLYELFESMPASSVQPILEYYNKVQAIKV